MLDSSTTVTARPMRATSFELKISYSILVPRPFSVPGRFAKHMMIVADLEHGNADAIEDAVIGAWELQSGAGP